MICFVLAFPGGLAFVILSVHIFFTTTNGLVIICGGGDGARVCGGYTEVNHRKRIICVREGVGC